ncbi:hypothetical protein CDL62_15240 [Alkalitalea saponilacus]|nr:hypothetical protein CDL62_15240 [Alkalitalea saponilacus]
MSVLQKLSRFSDNFGCAKPPHTNRRCQQAKEKNKHSLFNGRKMIATHKTAHLQTTQTYTQPKFAKELFSGRRTHR